MGDRTPLVSIGMPVYNAAHSLRSALESLLAQDYKNFELIVSDNRSTDSTQEICLDHAAKDKRIRYHRNKTNIGIINNFNKAFELSQGEYFMWAAHDDLKEPNYISSCLKIMEDNPNVILCCSKTLLKPNGNLKELKVNFSTMGMPAFNRFHKILWGTSCASIYGLMRSDVLKQTGLMRNVTGCDNVLLGELSLIGEFYQLPLFLFTQKVRPGSFDKKITTVFEPTLPQEHSRYKTLFIPLIKLASENWLIVQNSRLGTRDKFLSFSDIILCFVFKYMPFFIVHSAVTLYQGLSKLKK
jgi:glycosyltransferase involved in cell wall biosynthesis